MKKINKEKWPIPLLALLVMVSSLALTENVHAAPEIIIAPEAEGIPNNIVQQIVEENPNSNVINILDYGDISFDTTTLSPDLSIFSINNNQISIQSASAVTTKPVTVKTITNKQQQAKDEFKFSVAKGESVTLSREYKGTLKGSISGTYLNKADIGADITITGVFKKGTKYSGPPESSKYNSREFRMKFYQETGSYTQTYYKKLYLSGKLIKNEKVVNKGTYKKPTKWASYSLDSNKTNTTY